VIVVLVGCVVVVFVVVMDLWGIDLVVVLNGLVSVYDVLGCMFVCVVLEGIVCEVVLLWLDLVVIVV